MLLLLLLLLLLFFSLTPHPAHRRQEGHRKLFWMPPLIHVRDAAVLP